MKRRIKPTKSVITVEIGEPMMITASNKFSFEFLKQAFEDCLDLEASFSEEGYVAVVRPLHGITNEDVIYNLYDKVDDYFFQNDVNVQFKGLPRGTTRRLKLGILASVGKDIIRFISSLDSSAWLIVLFIGSLGFSVTPLLPFVISDFIFGVAWITSIVISALGVLVSLILGLGALMDSI